MSENKNRRAAVKVIKASNPKPIIKAETPTNVTKEDSANSGLWITSEYDMYGLKNMVKNSDILPQCITAYKNNIAGFGIKVRYNFNYEEETAEMKAEFDKAKTLVDLLCQKKAMKEVVEDIIAARETYGIAYLEVIRNTAGEVSELAFVEETPSISRSILGDDIIKTEYNYKGTSIQRNSRFVKYRQQLNGKTVYFKEFGDPRNMDSRNGEYVDDISDGVTLANELLAFPIGTDPYGEVRWIGQILGIDGAREASELNYRYFKDGRHTPLAIIVRGGSLSKDSEENLKRYADSIKGKEGQHAFLLLELEDTDDSAGFDSENKPDVELKDLSPMLQKDELFGNYLKDSRKSVQSAFRLPDIYVGYTADFNRATAQTAMEITERQVFQPERESLEFIINNRLLNGFGFKYVELYFEKPDISNPDDLQKILTVTERAGGLTPNKAKEIAMNAMGEISEDYTEAWGNVPLALLKIMQTETPTDQTGEIQKSVGNDTELVAVMKEVRAVLKKGSVTDV